jgi:asparagine synthase (glutamine-hydrolysing)
VVIGGDGGDEMFGGYPRFRYAEMARRMGGAPRWLLKAADASCGAFGHAAPEPTRQLRKMLRAAMNREERLMALSAYMSPAELTEAASPEAAERFPISMKFSHNGTLEKNAGGAEFMDATISTALPGDYLRKVDVMSSAHGLEVRVPFLGNQVLDLAAETPVAEKYSWFQGKIALRELAAKYLPAEVANKRKWGFGIPLDVCLGAKGRLELQSLLGSPNARIRDFLRPDYIDTLLRGFVSGDRDKRRISRGSLYQRAYFLWSLERWLTRWQPSA